MSINEETIRANLVIGFMNETLKLKMNPKVPDYIEDTYKEYVYPQYGKHLTHHDPFIRGYFNTSIVGKKLKNKIIDVDINLRLETILNDKNMISNMIKFNIFRMIF